MEQEHKVLGEDQPEQDPGAVSARDQTPFNLLVKTPQKEIVKLPVCLTDNVQDVKQALFEDKKICFVTSYDLYFNGVVVSEFDELSQIPGIAEGSTFEMVEAPYSSASCAYHIRRLRELLNTNSEEKPISVLASLAAEESSEAVIEEEPKVTPTPKKPTQNTSSGKGGKKKNQKKKKKPANTNNNNTGKGSRKPQPLETKNKLEVDLEEFDLKSFFPPVKSSHLECIHSICYSGWNPPPGNRQCRGDLCYLVIRTLENRTIHVTGSTNGFFINGSTTSVFDPLPVDKLHSHTLVGLLNAVSPLFKHNFELILENHFEKHPFEMLPVSYPELNVPWLGTPTKHTYDLNRMEDFIQGRDSGVANYPIDQLRDWNAEYQACKELPKSTAQERILRDRAIIKVYHDFVGFAVYGAKAIINGSIMPVNPTDPPPAHLYICNNIFFSHALNGRFLYEEGSDMGPYKQVNNDLRGVVAYNLFDIPELHTVLTTLVDYRGFRMVAQSIIPGILHQSGTKCIRYGAIDRGETLVWDEEFHELLSKVSTLLHVPDHLVEDEEGNQVKLCCSSDTKGVMGTDGRKYVLDLDRTAAHDVNFNESWTQLRLELNDIYIEYLKHQHFLQYKSQYEELARRQVERSTTLKSSSSTSKPEEQSDDTQQQQQQTSTTTDDSSNSTEQEQQEDSTSSSSAKTESTNQSSLDSATIYEEINEPDLHIPKFVPPKFNPNALALPHGKLVGDPEEIKHAEEQVRKLSAFLVDSVIPPLVYEMVTNTSYPTDSTTLTGLFHSRGVNMRYLGLVTKLLGSQKPFLKDLCVREMIVRSTKHVLNAFLRDLKEHEVASGVIHFLNCFIRGAHLQNYCNPNSPAQSHVVERFGIHPESLWDSIVKQINTQFHFEFQQEFKASKYILPTLRGLCQKTGIQIVARNYDFYSPLPLTEDDLLGFFPVVKTASPLNFDGHDLLDGGKGFLLKGRIDLAFEFLTEALAMFHQTYGPMHPFTAHCYSNLAMVLHHAGDITQALIHQKKAVIIHERTQGLDHHETAFGYGNLGLFCHQNGQTKLALKFIKRSLYLGHLIAGPDHPDNATTYSHIAMILQENKHYQEGLNYLLKALECTEYHYGPKHLNTAAACHAVAIAYSMLDGFRAALQYERRSYDILNELVGPNDIRTGEANIWLKQFTGKAVQVEVDASKNPESKSISGQKFNEPGKVPSFLNTDTADSSNISMLPVSDLLRFINNNADPVISRSQQRLRGKDSKLLHNVTSSKRS